MKYKNFIISTLILLIAGLILPVEVAHAGVAGSSAALTNLNETKPKDERVKILKGFLESNNSPLAPYSKKFVEEADKNQIDWKLVASIAGNESQFGLLIPPNSYNGWGYGVYGSNVRRFESWEEGISVVSQALRTDYIDGWKANNIYEIGSIYAEDPNWANKVMAYMNKIDEFESQNYNTTLSISL